jgi:hypothetical protein
MEQKTNWPSTILYIFAWLVCSILVLVDVLAIREASLDVMTAIRAGQIASSAEGEKNKTQIETGFMVSAIDQSFIIVSGIIAVGLAIAIEYYFRKGKSKGKLLQRIGLVLGIQVAVFVVCVLIQTFV